MNFTGYQWLICFVLDFLLKAGLFYLIGGFTLNIAPVSLVMSFALGFSAFHFFALFIASGLGALFDLTRAAKFTLTVVMAETLFTAGVSLWTVAIVSENVAKCPGYARSCPWSNIDSQGIQTVIWTAVVLLVFNLIPILISAASGRLASHIRQLRQKSRANTAVSD